MKKRLLFRFEAGVQLGMGHWFRTKTIASVCKDCEIYYCVSSQTAEYLSFEDDKHVVIVETNNDIIEAIKKYDIDCVINDILNTSSEYMQALRSVNGLRIINMEDEGDGAKLADAVINELYEKEEAPSNFFYGYKYCCLDDGIKKYNKRTFSQEISKIVVLFGCSDPSNLSLKTLKVLNCLEINLPIQLQVDLIIGPGNERYDELETWKQDNYHNSKIEVNLRRNADIREAMSKADFGISSQGRTMFELAYYNVPTIILAQNPRETLHLFADENNGFIALGEGVAVDDSVYRDVIEKMIIDIEFRKSLFEKMERLQMENGIDEVKKIICDL